MNPARARGLSLLLSVAGTGLALMFAGQPWVIAQRSDGGSEIHATGSQLLGSLMPAAIAVLLLSLALTLVPSTLRRLLAITTLTALAVLIGMVIAVTIAPAAFLDSAAIRSVTGISGDPAQYIAGVAVTAVPFFVIAAFVVALTGSAIAAWTSPRWPDRGQVAKSATERAAKSAHAKRVDAWDELSSGDDPTTEAQPAEPPR